MLKTFSLVWTVSSEINVGEPSGSAITALVLYGCDMWSPTVMEEYVAQMSEKSVLWRIFGH
jgi:hypothetical protein